MRQQAHSCARVDSFERVRTSKRIARFVARNKPLHEPFARRYCQGQCCAETVGTLGTVSAYPNNIDAVERALESAAGRVYRTAISRGLGCGGGELGNADRAEQFGDESPNRAPNRFIRAGVFVA